MPNVRFEVIIEGMGKQIADLKNQLETWKVIQRTNDATIKMWQDIHQKDQQCIAMFLKQFKEVTAENVELKRKIAEEVKENQFNKEFDEAKAIFEAMLSE